MIERAADAEPGFVQDVGVNHGGGDVFVAEEFLDGANIIAALDEMGGEAVPECVTAGRFRNPSGLNGVFDGVLKVFLADMVTAGLAGTRIDGKFSGGEDVLPAPIAGGARVFSFQCEGEVNGAAAASEVLLMDEFNALQVHFEGSLKARGQEGNALAHAFAIADGYLVVAEVEVFDAQAECFHQAQAAAVEELGHETVVAFELGDDGVSLGAGKNDGELGRAADTFDAGDEVEFAVEDLLKEKEQGAEGLILGGGGDVSVNGKVAEERGNLFLPHGIGMAFAMKENEAANPIEVNLFGADAVAFDAKMPADAVEEFRRRRRQRRRSFGETNALSGAGDWSAENGSKVARC